MRDLVVQPVPPTETQSSRRRGGGLIQTAGRLVTLLLFPVLLPFFFLALFRETCAGGTWLQQLDKV